MPYITVVHDGAKLWGWVRVIISLGSDFKREKFNEAYIKLID
jgi:hypothetical protein